MPEGSEVPSDDGEALTEAAFREMYKYQPLEEIPIVNKIKKSVACSSSTVSNVFPILGWLPQYRFRRDVVGDMVAGLTVAVMHIPHGLAYAPLAGQTPVVGLYMAVFPTLMYLFLGTSRHISLGTFAVVCMMVGKTVSDHSTVNSVMSNETMTEGYTNLDVGVSICFLVGVWQFVMGALHLGSLWLLLSNSLVSGFTTGAAVHVVTYQIKNLLGVPAGGFSGPLKWLYIVVDLISHVPDTNLVTLGLSCCAIFILSCHNELVKPIIQRKFTKLRVPIPMELIVIMLGIAVSYFMDLEKQYQVDIVKSVPVGLPKPVLPVPELFPAILLDCFVIGVVGISMSLSLATIFAQKNGYDIRQNQELVAYGASNMFAAFFQCVPCSASLSRSLVQSSVGGKTQIASVFTMATIVLILLFLGPLFEPVPYSVLSSIVVVTLKGLLWQVKDFPQIWRLSKLDGSVWLITFLSVVLIDLDIGLGIGLATSVITLVLRGQTPSVIQLGRIPDSNLYMDANLYKTVELLPNILILKVTGGLHFANFSSAHDKVMKFYKDFQLSNILRDDKTNLALILDLSCVPSFDPTSAGGLLSFYKDLKLDNCNLILTDCNPQAYDFLQHCKFFDEFPKQNVFISTAGAVLVLNKNS